MIPVSGVPSSFANVGDKVQFGGVWNRHPVASLAWWVMLILHPARAGRYCGWAFGHHKETDPVNMLPKSRCGLFAKRKLQTFTVTETAQERV